MNALQPANPDSLATDANRIRAREPTMQPRVSVLLFTYNHERYIRACLESVLVSDYDPLEIFVWNNCSTDATGSILDYIAYRNEGPHEVTVHHSDYNYHPSFVPMNTAMARVRGEYIVFLSGDDYQAPERIRKSVDVMERSGAAASSCSAYLIDEEGRPTGTRNRLDEKDEFKQFSTAHDFATIPGSPVCFGAGLAWHRSVFDRFGPLQEGPRNADVMIPFRGALLGGNYYIDEPLVYRRLHEETIALPEARKQSQSEEDSMLIKERQLSNRLANFVRMTEEVEAFAPSRRRRREIRTVVQRMRGHTMRICSRWVEHRSAMAKAGIGIV